MALRPRAKQNDPEGSRLSYLERDGNLSVILHDPKPRVLEVAIENELQTVRISLEG